MILINHFVCVCVVQATAQSEQEVRFTSQLGELRGSIGVATSKLGQDCDLLRQEASTSTMNLQVAICISNHDFCISNAEFCSKECCIVVLTRLI